MMDDVMIDTIDARHQSPSSAQSIASALSALFPEASLDSGDGGDAMMDGELDYLPSLDAITAAVESGAAAEQASPPKALQRQPIAPANPLIPAPQLRNLRSMSVPRTKEVQYLAFVNFNRIPATRWPRR